ncbi:hypothetical protein [Bradyrhizobium sp. USDA 3311]
MFGRFRGVMAYGNGLALERAPAPVDPSKPDPRARAEMEAFDLLPPEAREAVRSSANDVSLVGKIVRIRNMGAPRSVLERLRSRSLLPYQVGEGGVLAEMVAEELGGAGKQ